MSMTLTPDDLQAIGFTVKPIFDKSIADAIEESDQRTAAGFAEVHEKFAVMQGELNGVKSGLSSVKFDLESVKHDLGGFKHDLGGFKHDLGGVKQDLGGVKQDLGIIKEDLGNVKQTVERIERVQRAEIMRVDHQESTIKKMRKAFKTI